MTTINLWRAEWLKTRKSPINWLLVGMPVFIGLLFLTYMFIATKLYPENYVKDAEMLLSYPACFYIGVKVISTLATLLAIVFIANSTGQEYTQDTWKMLLPRYGSRIKFIITKILMGLFAMLLLYAIGLAFWVGYSVLIIKVLGIGSTAPANAQELELRTALSLSNGLKYMVLQMWSMCFYGSATLLVTIAARSASGGFLAGMASSIALASASVIPVQKIAICVPTLHMTNVEARWFQDKKLLQGINNAFGREFSSTASITIVFAIMAFFLFVALYNFRKRDMAGG